MIGQKSLGNDYDDITYNYTYLYDMKIVSDFHFFNVISFSIEFI